MTEAPEQGTDLVERLREYAGWANYSSLRNLLAEAADEITRLRLAAVWRDISTAPKDGTEILVHWETSRVHAVVRWDEQETEWLEGPDCPVSGMSHWMPLPAPPIVEAVASTITPVVRSGEAASEHPISPPEGLARE